MRLTTLVSLASLLGGCTGSSIVNLGSGASDANAGGASNGGASNGGMSSGSAGNGGGTGGTACDCISPSDCGIDSDCQIYSCDACVCSVNNAETNTICDDGAGCDASTACVCDANGACVAANCTDGLKNGDESDVDCGGSCSACENCNTCNSNTDCESGYCDPSSCAAGGAGGTGGSGGASANVCAACSNHPQCDDDKWCSPGSSGSGGSGGGSATASCEPDLAQGSPCTDDAECVGNVNCIDDFCCDTACGGSCDVCSQVKGASADGTCTVLPYGTLGEPLCSSMICNGVDGDCQSACMSQALDPTLRMADIVFVIDNSGSMTQEIASVEQNINTFATTIGNTGVDYQVIMLTEHGPNSLNVCVEAPLSTIAAGGCPTVGTGPPGNIAGKFYHYSHNVQSHDAFCKILSTFDTADTPFGLAPTGWQAWLRPKALKVFIMITDDGTNCTFNGTAFNDGNSVTGGQTAAVAFDQALTTLSPGQFGTPTNRNYMWYSIIGIGQKNPMNPLEPHDEFDPVVTTECTGAVDPGTAYQWLSVGTDALRFPICGVNGSIINLVAQDITSKAGMPCSYEIPEPPVGKTVDETTMLVEHSDLGTTVSFPQVANAAACTSDEFYIESGKIRLCASACTKADTSGTLEAHYQCL